MVKQPIKMAIVMVMQYFYPVLEHDSSLPKPEQQCLAIQFSTHSREG